MKTISLRRSCRRAGFTLMEMLIVVAIIAVLVIIAIPVLAKQLEKSREAADMANIRSAYAEVMIEYLSEDDTDLSRTVELVQKEDGWVDGSTAPDTLNSLGTVIGLPAAEGSCEVYWPDDGDKIVFDFGGGGGGNVPNRSEGRYIGDQNNVKSIMTGIAAFIYDTMKDSSPGSIRWTGSTNNADGIEWLATDYRALHPSDFSGKLIEWGSSKGTYADYMGDTDITNELISKTGVPEQTDIYLDKTTNLPIAVGYYKDGTASSDYMITYLDENGDPAETRDIGYPNYRQCFAYQKEYVLEHFDENTRPASKLGN